MPGLSPETLQTLLFGTERLRRFTQASPVMPDVWMEYNEKAGEPVDLLFTPHERSNARELYKELREQLLANKGRKHNWELTYNDAYVVGKLTFTELVRAALPLSKWWSTNVWRERRTGQVPAQPIKGVQTKEPLRPPPVTAKQLQERINQLQGPVARRRLAAKIKRRRAAADPDSTQDVNAQPEQ
jgi:hypothetical protein